MSTIRTFLLASEVPALKGLAALVLFGLFVSQSLEAQSFKGFSLPRSAEKQRELRSHEGLLADLRLAAPKCQVVAALELARRRDSQALGALITAVEKAKGRAREDLVIAMGLLGNSGARPYLESLARRGSFAAVWLQDRKAVADPALRAAAVLGLGFLSSKGAREALQEIVLDPAGQAAEVHLAACMALGLRAAADAARRDPLFELADREPASDPGQEVQVASLVKLARSSQINLHSRAALLISLAQAFPRYKIVQGLIEGEIRKGRPELSRAARDAKGLIKRALAPRLLAKRTAESIEVSPSDSSARRLRAEIDRRKREFDALRGVVACLQRSGQTGQLQRHIKTLARVTN